MKFPLTVMEFVLQDRFAQGRLVSFESDDVREANRVMELTETAVGRRRDFDPVTFARFDSANRPIFNDGYVKLNAAGSYHPNRFVSAFARVENLLNQDYEEIFGYPAYRLNFSAGLRLRAGGGK